MLLYIAIINFFIAYISTSAVKNIQDIEKRSPGSFSTQLLSEHDLWELAIKVKIGTPAKEFTLLFDTGSSDTWVPSIDCSDKDGCPSVMHHFDSSKSTSYKPLNENFVISYAASTSTGKYFSDVMTLSDNYSIPDQVLSFVDNSFGPLSKQTSPGTDTIYLDGVMGAGLATSTVRYQQGGPRFDPIPIQLYTSGIISEPFFAVSMDDQEKGQVMFGEIPNGYDDKVVYTDISPATNTHWSVQVKTVQFMNHTFSLDFNFVGQTNFLVDTGSNFMYLPKKMALELANLIAPNVEQLEDGRLSIDCKYQNTPNIISFIFPKSKDSKEGDPILKIPLSDLIAKREEDGKCFFLFIPSETNAVFGNMILRKLVTVFDFGKNRIGFAYNHKYNEAGDNNGNGNDNDSDNDNDKANDDKSVNHK